MVWGKHHPLTQVTPLNEMKRSMDKCIGTLPRRNLLKLGISGLSGLGLADLLRLQGYAAEDTRRHSLSANAKSVIVLWLWGGPSHMETFDLKPDAPSEYRGEFRPIKTNVPGLEISEHLPLLAKQADKIAILRSLHHDSPGHVNSTHTMVTGYPGNLVETPPYSPDYPDFWSVVSRMRGSKVPGVPPHVAMPRIRYYGSAHLGSGIAPFYVDADPNSPKFSVPNLGISTAASSRLRERLDLREQFDDYRRIMDATGTIDSLDAFHQKAATMLTSSAIRDAFDLEKENTATRDRYGRHTVGQQCLLARRLVEAGARLVTIDFPYVPGQKAKSWDDHASVWNIFEEMRQRLPVLDQVSSALIEDLWSRGLQRDVLFIVMGEMSHTPRLSNFNGQPGREHWAQTMSLMMAGGGLRMGQAIGATNIKGDEPVSRPLQPNDLLATLYRYFDIPLDLQFLDRRGRPTPILPSGEVIHELI